MNPEEIIMDAEEADARPRRQRKKQEDRRVFVYRMIDGRPKEQGSFPETTIGTPLERRLPMFLKEVFGTGEYKVETRKTNGQFEQSFDFSISTVGDDRPAPPQHDRSDVIDVEPAAAPDAPKELSFEQKTGQMSAAEVENLLLKERLRRMEEDIARHKTGNQSETQTLISALEESRREQRELMMMMLNRSQQPQQDATAQAMNILERSLGIVTKAKAISEEIAPHDSGGGGGMLADGAKLIDSLGRNAGTFLPMLMGAGSLMSRPQTPIAPAAPRYSAPQPPNDPPMGSAGELSELAKKIQQKEGDKK